MSQVQIFVFSPFQENTYIVSDQDGHCAIIDPGCYEAREQRALFQYIEENGLQPKRLLNTHCHLDHIFGNWAVQQRYQLPLEAHADEIDNLRNASEYGLMFGIPDVSSPMPEKWLEEGQEIEIGRLRWKVLFAPGHSPGHVCFWQPEENYVIGGDVLFREGIGRTDLPGGSHTQLLESIRQVFFALPEDCTVYCGHGPTTTIGHEKHHNPFLIS
jgi:glyoxylase-like metal-dependent hydrolase (beta-lactamase superfamily II)